MLRFSNFGAVFSILLLAQVMVVQAFPEPRTTDTKCGIEGQEPYCPSGYVCCGPFFEPIGGGTAFGRWTKIPVASAKTSLVHCEYSAKECNL
ncbi:hypothetical protein BT96DRAFT_999209 [Gymnopus androsaceus JB14]|uniref:CBM1 domain-containing protein n=1 Tax=Gymnopus androsaceus JB14 TaxID=1447944 RepID=A0A6A4H8M8_9AGAR|nr:hypothetical protein BT96DRAFT_999209 [Gymnopus androsaceus JB14]